MKARTRSLTMISRNLLLLVVGSVFAACGSSSNGGSGSSGNQGITVVIAPASTSVPASGSRAFTCTVTGSSNTACSWSVQESAGGAITSAGVYTAPATTGVYHVVATSAANSSATATATVIVPSVGDCTSLPAVGTWENITPAAFTTPANQQTVTIAINPQQPNVLFTAAGNITNGACPSGQTCPKVGTGVYTSTDCGKTFTALSMGPDNAFAGGDLWSIRIDPQNPQTMYLMNGYGGPPTLFKSGDSGKTWTNLFTDPMFTTKSDSGGTFQYGGFVRSFDLDTADPTHLVVAFHEDCMGPVAASASDAINGAVMCFAETHDSGTTWKIFEGPIPPASADGGAFTILGPSTLIYTNSGSPTGTGWYTNDATRNVASWTPIFTYAEAGPFTALNQAGGYFAPDGTFYIGAANGIYLTTPGTTFGKTWTKIPNSPGAIIVGGDDREAANGGTLFVSSRNMTQPISSGPLGPSSTFTSMNATASLPDSAQTFVYDPTHHILYAAGWSDGLWRVVTY